MRNQTFTPNRLLAYTVAFDPPESGSYRQMARMLAASAARTYLGGDLYIIRNTEEPLFRVERVGMEEVYIPTSVLEPLPLDELGRAWRFDARRVFPPDELSRYDAVMFVDADCLVLRNLDHLFDGSDWDILYQPEPGRSIRDPVSTGYPTDEEREPSQLGINAGTWVVRSEIYHDVMAAAADIMAANTQRDLRGCSQAAWSRLILDAEAKHGWRAKPFESHEIQFPLHLDLDWRRYKDAAILHCVGAETLEKIQFMFGMYMQTFFHDLKGTMVTLLDM